MSMRGSEALNVSYSGIIRHIFVFEAAQAIKYLTKFYNGDKIVNISMVLFSRQLYL